MPKIKLQSFIDQVKHENSTLSSATLCLKTRSGFNSFITALNDPENKGVQALTELDLSGSNLNIDKIKALLAALNKHPNIKTLHLNNCKITDELSLSLSKLEHVVSLSLKDNLLKNRPMFSTKLESLYLDNNPKINSKLVLHFLNTYARNIQVLSLANCNVQDSAFTLLDPRRSILPKLTFLNLRDNKVSFNGVADLVAIKTLVTLDLGNNRFIGNDGIKSLKELDQLETLYVDNCSVGVSGLEHIAVMNLKTVDLSYNAGLKASWDQSFVDIAPNKSLRTMRMMFCGISDNHVESLHKSFPEVSTLVLANNKLTPKGVIDLVASPNTQSLDVGTHQFYKKPGSRGSKIQRKALVTAEKAKMEPLLEAIRTAPALTELNLEGTGLTNKMILSLIPTPEEAERKLKRINGVPCKKLKRTLEQEIEIKREAKELSRQEVISEPPVSPREEVVEILPQPKLTRKEKRIQQLEAENASLKEALAAAQAEIALLKGKASPEILTSAKSVRNMANEIESKLSSHSLFAAKKSGLVKAKKVASDSIVQPSNEGNGSSNALN